MASSVCSFSSLRRVKASSSTLFDVPWSGLQKCRTFFPVSPAFLESFGKTPPSHQQGVAAKKLFLTFDCKHKILHSFGSRITFQSVAFSPAVLYFEKRYFKISISTYRYINSIHFKYNMCIKLILQKYLRTEHNFKVRL